MTLFLEGAKAFRHRLVLATLLDKTIRVTNIRAEAAHPGLRDHEVDFLRLLAAVSKGSHVEINETGTSFLYKPGLLEGGDFTHETDKSRSVGYYALPLLLLLPFGQRATTVELTGITNANDDVSVDMLRAVTIPLLERFGVEPGTVSLRVAKRGSPPLGGGRVVVECGVVRQLTPVEVVDPGLVRTVRGIAYSSKTSPQMANRMGEAAKGVLLTYTNDVFVSTDHAKGKEASDGPGYGCALVAKTTTGCAIGTELFGEPGDVPEDIGQTTASALLREIAAGGCVDSTHQPWVTILMALCSEDVSRVRTGEVTLQTAECLRCIRDVAGVVFHCTREKDGSALLSCQGCGFKNIMRKTN